MKCDEICYQNYNSAYREIQEKVSANPVKDVGFRDSFYNIVACQECKAFHIQKGFSKDFPEMRRIRTKFKILGKV